MSKRLRKAASELNIAVSRAKDFLESKGHELEKKPDPKLSEDMLNDLLREFAKDAEKKAIADEIELSRFRNKEKEAEPVAEKPAPKKEEVKEVIIESNIEKPEPAAPVVEEKQPEVKEPEPVAKTETAKPVEAETPVAETTKAEITEKPKVVGKIDLEKVTPKKPKKEEAPVAKKPKKEEAPAKKEKAKPVQAKDAKDKAKAKPEEGKENFRETKKIQLSGPKVLGKIELPKNPEKKEKAAGGDANKGKRKRKRIVKPVNKGGGHGNRGKKGAGANRRGKKDDDKPNVSEKEIQEKIKATMAKIGGSGGKKRQRLRRDKRDSHAEKLQQQQEEVNDSLLQLSEYISVSELASLMNVSVTEVISKCMSLGVIVSINQRLDAEVIELVAGEFGYETEFISVTENEEEEEEIIDDPEDMTHRAPIVTIMGHVDHGKTSLLDYIREANVIAGEVGGITQHIGAYEVTLPKGDKITFLDTPGHEAFTAMRARGAKVTDIAIIVIAADDAVMPQTKEAISHAQAAGVPMIFAINKIDKETATPDRIREQLSQMNILVEEWGGKFQCQEVSAKSGLNVDALLDKVLLEAEMLELKANADRNANGTIVEASLDKGKGYVANILVQAGTLRVGDLVVAGGNFGRVKAMYDERNKKIKEAGPSTPCLLLGLDGAPQAGEKFRVYSSENEAKEVANKRKQIIREQGLRAKKHITLDEIGRRLALGNFKELNLIIKGDVDGSIEATSDALQKLSTEEIQVNIIHKSVGAISETDVMLASASDAIIVGFQVRPSGNARRLAETEGVEIRMYSIIYQAVEEIRSAMEGMLEPTIEERITCNLDVREVFKITKVGTIAGCLVTEGKINRNTKVRLIRDGIVVYTGELSSLKRFKDDVKEVLSGMECGCGIKNYNDLKVGDIIEGYEEIEIKRTLGDTKK